MALMDQTVMGIIKEVDLKLNVVQLRDDLVGWTSGGAGGQALQEAAKALNAGADLPNTPEGKQLKNAIGVWVGAKESSYQEVSHKDLLAQALQVAPANSPQLYRGLVRYDQDRYGG